MQTTDYELYYWPGLPGRGEYIRLVFEAAEVAYKDYAKIPESQGGGVPALTRWLQDEHVSPRPFAPPFVRIDGKLLAQTPLICDLLGRQLGLAPEGAQQQAAALQLQLTIADLVTEAHDVHHPLGSGLYYEDQRQEAQRCAELFRSQRLPKFLNYFEHRLADAKQPSFFGQLSYVDLSMFQTLEGLFFAFPEAMRSLNESIPRLSSLRAAVAEDPAIAAYLQSERRLAFNSQGIFRHYPELDRN